MSVASEIPGFWAVVPAGGAGTRLWPLSRRRSPKFLHDLTGSGRTLLQATWDRLAPLAADRVVVVTGRDHAPVAQIDAGDRTVGREQERVADLLSDRPPRRGTSAVSWRHAIPRPA